MDPPVASINTERFTTYWEVIQGEANKLASGVKCSGMKIYSSIYHIVCGGDVSYAVRLHWCIGKFFFAFCVKLREKIQGEDWVKEYAAAFNIYENTVETIDLLSLHLNEAILENKECKNVKDLGYIIWERCILRQRYEGNLPALSESLPKRRKYAEVCLRSLSKIITNSENRFEYYKNNYEAGLFSLIIEEFKYAVNIQGEIKLASYLLKCSNCIKDSIKTYTPLLLPISLPALEEALEKVIFSKHPHAVKEEMLRILMKKDKQEIKDLCLSARLLSKKVFPAFLECIKEFINNTWTTEKTCQAAIATYIELSDLLMPDKCAKTLCVLKKVLSTKISLAGIGKEMGDYLESLINEKNVDKIKQMNILLDSLPIKEEKQVFYNMYTSKLAERLYSLKFDPAVEKETIVNLNLPWLLKKKVNKIFDDMVQSTNENELFKQAYGAEHFRYLTSNSNEIFFYGIITTACVWPISEEAIQTTRFPAEIDSILTAFSGQYLAKHARRRLAWADALSIIEVEITTDKVYNVSMSLTHYSVLDIVEKSPGMLDHISKEAGLSTKATANLIEPFVRLSIIQCTNEIYSINSKFTSATENITIQAAESTLKRIGNRKSYYQAWISRKLKQMGECPLNALSDTLQKTHTSIFEWNVQEYSEALRSLNDRGLVEIADTTIKYLP
ncbi:hypothetical protein NEPAR06_0202 [Nematocida parisii]|uniref:Cullin family profile domain-containing protein n=1 Tax=Nematocida parisii (strain ERTm3) TaxID=935791 RepID=I3EDD0_NEMP3|nr:uncharacterized protein NEPG_00599 [Nematocida parisii ERTm1]EIJ87227.1 hypothetical protein NEQG_02562 [Nematocida parisii ERTm3]KAI5126611.1 hypothetical protein NEPAR08_0530 [Nematocida parisii]EIJ95074.1 hypothetical protein NEPG_00599 [Nematocida parisii ERTm1]KAI5127894.1 hypothetical protein NEPAR03_1174 [Nematocida parisii]KAI5142832.1 hypothetical protein NEPAR04_1652 [Nematocida parisii]|eukprot:XP_013058430.1 hypothetical protein NEPG_00599 [Nematocida parisii ERTm1]